VSLAVAGCVYQAGVVTVRSAGCGCRPSVQHEVVVLDGLASDSQSPSFPSGPRSGSKPLSGFEHTCCQPVPDHVPGGEIAERRHKPVVVDPIERRRQIRVQNPCPLGVFPAQRVEDRLDRVLATTTAERSSAGSCRWSCHRSGSADLWQSWPRWQVAPRWRSHCEHPSSSPRTATRVSEGHPSVMAVDFGIPLHATALCCCAT
jgi:hypothetical protein